MIVDKNCLEVEDREAIGVVVICFQLWFFCIYRSFCFARLSAQIQHIAGCSHIYFLQPATKRVLSTQELFTPEEPSYITRVCDGIIEDVSEITEEILSTIRSGRLGLENTLEEKWCSYCAG